MSLTLRLSGLFSPASFQTICGRERGQDSRLPFLSRAPFLFKVITPYLRSRSHLNNTRFQIVGNNSKVDSYWGAIISSGFSVTLSVPRRWAASLAARLRLCIPVEDCLVAARQLGCGGLPCVPKSLGCGAMTSVLPSLKKDTPALLSSRDLVFAAKANVSESALGRRFRRNSETGTIQFQKKGFINVLEVFLTVLSTN